MSSTTQEEEKIVSLPEGYVVPKQWSPPTQSMGGTINSMNLPTAGKRFEAELQRGKHDLQLYSVGTPNGIKVTILLEELGIEYDAWFMDIFGAKEQFGSAFVDINPNSKIPALLDYSGCTGSDDEKKSEEELATNQEQEPIRVFESGSILLYLAERYEKFIPTDIRKKTECMNWLMWQMGTAPYLGGGFGHFYSYAPIKIEYAIDRFTMETKRIVDVLDQHLQDKEYICDDEYTIADMAIFPWIRCLDVGYKANEFLQMDEYKNVQRWMETLQARDAVQRGLRVNGFRSNAVKDRHSKTDF
jgi:GST-like protein